MKRFLGFFLAIFILFACNSIDEITPIIGSVNLDDLIEKDTVTLLIVSVDPSFQTSQSDDWIFISNPEGHVLGAKRFESEEVFTMKAYIESKTPYVNVSLLQVLNSGSRTLFNLRSYADIKRAKKWHISRLVEEKRKFIGNINIKINNSPRPTTTHYQVSDDFGGQSFSSIYSNGITTLVFNLFESVSKIGVTVATNSNEVKFLEINNPSIFGDYTFDYYNDFDFPTHHAVISLPQNNYVFATVRGLMDLSYNKRIRFKGLAQSESMFINGADKIAMGYNNGFPYYFTELTLNRPGYLYHYEKLGDSPVLDGISIPENPISINSNIFSSFTISGADDHEHQESSWDWTETVDGKEHILKWIVNCPLNKHPVFLELPGEIEFEYPFLDFDYDRMYLETANVINNISDYSYEDMVENFNKSNEEDYRPYEYEKITVRN